MNTTQKGHIHILVVDEAYFVAHFIVCGDPATLTDKMKQLNIKLEISI